MVMNYLIATLRAILIFLGCSQCLAQTSAIIDKLEKIEYGSAAELWAQRTQQNKLGYIEGLCNGFRASQTLMHLSRSTCDGNDLPLPVAGKKIKWAFCGDYSADERKAISYFDAFYSESSHSDIPHWAAIGAYNDKACGESHTLMMLPKLQARQKCYRVYSNMRAATQVAKQAQLSECKKLPE